jgi:hypothetical protein
MLFLLARPRLKGHNFGYFSEVFDSLVFVARAF